MTIPRFILANIALAKAVGQLAADAQERNAHTETQWIIAKAFGTFKMQEAFEAIDREHNRAGELTPRLSRDRNDISRNLAQHIYDTNRQAWNVLQDYAILWALR